MLKLIGWFAANIAVPYLAPLILIKGIQRFRLDLKPEQLERMRLTYLLKEGQLSVASVALASVSVHDLFANPETLHEALGIVLAVFLGVLVVANAFCFVCGTVIGSPPPTTAFNAGSFREWAKVYPIAFSSMVLAVGATACALSTHILVEGVHHDPKVLPISVEAPSKSAPHGPGDTP